MGRFPWILSYLSLHLQFTRLQVPPSSSPDRPHLPMLPAPAQHPAPSFSHFTLNVAKWSPSPTPAPQLALKGAGGVIITCSHLVPSPIYSPRQFSALPPPAISRGPSLLFQGGRPLHSRPPAAPSPPSLPFSTSSLLPIGSFGVLVPTHRTESLEVPRGSHLRVSLGTTGFVLCLHWSPLLLPLRDFSPCSGLAGFGLSLKESCPAPLLE